MVRDRIAKLLAVPIFCLGVKTVQTWLVAAIVGLAALQSAAAEVRISGTPDALKIEAQNATVEDVLRALQTSYSFKFQSANVLTSPAGGVYNGSLSRVVARLLEGQNYVIRNSGGVVQISIISPNSARRPAASRQPQNQPPPFEPPKDCKFDNGIEVIAVEC